MGHRDILQRLGRFLKDKQNLGPQMYKSKQKALKLYIDPKTREDFLALSDVMLDVAFLPEYIESQFSNKENIKTRIRFGGLRVVKPIKGGYKYPEIGYITYHRLDLAATLPLAVYSVNCCRSIMPLASRCGLWTGKKHSSVRPRSFTGHW